MRLLTVLLAGALFSGCVNLDSDAPPPVSGDADDEPAPIALNKPYNGTLTRFGTSSLHATSSTGQGIWVHDNKLYWTNGGDLYIIDVSDPEHPVDLGNVTGLGARDVDITIADNRTFAVLAGSGFGIHVVDVTNATDPYLFTTITMPSAGVHNLASVPGTGYVYSSGASGQTKRIDTLDLTDPDNPSIGFFPIPATMGGVPVESDGCHDITVRSDLGRAYCAGGGGTYAGLGGESFIWDISEDPLNPEWIVMIDDPRIKYHHQALVNDDGTILVLDDEHIVADNCVAADVPGVPGSLDPQIPTGAAWIYDISDETNPVLTAIVQNPETFDMDALPPTPNVNCGSHFGDIILGQDAFVMGWYSGGTLLVSFDDPVNPEILDIQKADTSHWDARYWRGYVFHSGNDLVITELV